MSKWSPRHNNRRHLAQAAHLIDNAIDHLLDIHRSYPEDYKEHREAMEAYCAMLQAVKEEIDGYRSSI